MLYPPVRYCSSASFLSFFSGTTLLLPPAWQAAQLPRKTPSPFSRSAAKAGRPPIAAASSPSVTPKANGLHALSGADSAVAPAADNGTEATPDVDELGATRGANGPTKQIAAPRTSATAGSKRARWFMAGAAWE